MKPVIALCLAFFYEWPAATLRLETRPFKATRARPNFKCSLICCLLNSAKWDKRAPWLIDAFHRCGLCPSPYSVSATNLPQAYAHTYYSHTVQACTQDIPCLDAHIQHSMHRVTGNDAVIAHRHATKPTVDDPNKVIT